MRIADLWLRLRALVSPGRTERDLHDELTFHLAMQARKHRAAGMDEPQTRQSARRAFGSTAHVEDACRDVRGISFFETLWQDLRYAVRSLRRAPIFAATVVATIALGLGLNTAVFTIFNAYVLTPFSVRDPYSLFEFGWNTRAGRMHRFSWPEFDHARQDSAVFSEMFAERHQLVTRIDGRTAYMLVGTGNYFRLLCAGHALGRVPD